MQKSTYLDATKLDLKFTGDICTRFCIENNGSWVSKSCLGDIPILYLKKLKVDTPKSIHVQFTISKRLFEICPNFQMYIDKFLNDIEQENLMDLVCNFSYSPKRIQFDFTSIDMLGYYKAVFFASLMRCISWYPYIILNYKWLKDKKVTPHFFNRLQLAQLYLNEDLYKERKARQVAYGTEYNISTIFDGGHFLFDKATIYLLSSEMKLPNITNEPPPRGFFVRDHAKKLNEKVQHLLSCGCGVSDYKEILKTA